MTPAEVAAVEASLVTVRFCGRSCRVAPKLAAVLAKVETHLRAEYARTMGAMTTPTFAEWTGVYGCGGYRKGGGWHAKGLAVDIEYRRQGYLVTRTRTARGVVYGGEAAGAGFKGVREAFAAACDRACMALDGAPADLSARKAGESSGAVWDRWARVDRAVGKYLAPYYFAVDDLDAGDADVIPGVDIPAQIAADYQSLRVPLVVGQPLPSPRLTRNPAKQLMAWQRHTFVALADVGGMRMGLSDMSAGASGDCHHVDLAPRIPSGAV